MGDFLRAEVAAGRTYLPAGANVLRAFQQPFDDVRVLIVGQDPYPTPGMAIGLSFAVSPEVRSLPGSLENIFRELHTDLGLPRPSNGDLTPWTEQGVLLLNRALTTAPRKPAAHRGKGWEEVTEQAIRALVARGTPLVSVLWGRDARNLRPLLGISRRSSPHIPRRCRPIAGSSAHVPSAGPMNSWSARVRSRWTGACLRARPSRRGGTGAAPCSLERFPFPVSCSCSCSRSRSRSRSRRSRGRDHVTSLTGDAAGCEHRHQLKR